MNHHLKALVIGTGIFLIFGAVIFSAVGLMYFLVTLPYNIGFFVVMLLLIYFIGAEFIKDKEEKPHREKKL